MLLGGTDLTLAVAQRLSDIGHPPAGVVYLQQTFSISYSPTGVKNQRHADLAGWCRLRSIPHVEYNGPQSITTLQNTIGADFALAAGWYHLVSASTRALFPLGVAGIHHSLLPKLRGGAPLNWALLSNEAVAGTSIFLMSDGVDDGPLLGQRSVPIGQRTKIGELVLAAQEAALGMLDEIIPKLAAGTLKPKPQIGSPTYCLQRTPDDSRIDWSRSASEIDRLVRASSQPYAGAWCTFGDQRLVIWDAVPISDAPKILGAPGQLFRLPSRGPCVVAGMGVVEIVSATDDAGVDQLPRLLASGQRRLN
ncbi:MAG: formyltransferase family protein [Pseudomonadota bacterium]